MDKHRLVKDIFSSVANKYNLMNNLMSCGIHHCWKQELVKEINLKKHFTLLDVAGGTGDVTMRVLGKCTQCEVTICDNNLEMIEQGLINTTNKGYVNINWVCGDAEKLPFSSNTYDYYTVAFGMRNFSNIELALKEAYRILKPNGRFICLEFSHIEDNFLLSKLYRLYSDFIIPTLGKMVTGNKEAYQYLVDSIQAFPTQEQFVELISKAGFIGSNFRNLNNGIAAIHTAFKLDGKQ